MYVYQSLWREQYFKVRGRHYSFLCTGLVPRDDVYLIRWDRYAMCPVNPSSPAVVAAVDDILRAPGLETRCRFS